MVVVHSMHLDYTQNFKIKNYIFDKSARHLPLEIDIRSKLTVSYLGYFFSCTIEAIAGQSNVATQHCITLSDIRLVLYENITTKMWYHVSIKS